MIEQGLFHEAPDKAAFCCRSQFRSVFVAGHNSGRLFSCIKVSLGLSEGDTYMTTHGNAGDSNRSKAQFLRPVEECN